jgi:DNA polymerase-4
LGDWALALAEKAAGNDAGGWFDEAIGEESGPKSVSHEHTFSHDVSDRDLLDTTLAKLVEKVCRRLREYRLHARRIQIKLRYADFSTFTRARTLEHPSQIEAELLPMVRELFQKNYKPGSLIRLLGVQAAMFAEPDAQLHLDSGARDKRWQQAMGAADKLRDKFGEQAVSLGAGMRANIRERTHENPVALPGKHKKE